MKSPELLVQSVEDLLNKYSVSFDRIEHAPEGNCEKVSALRGNDVHAAAKAICVCLKISNKRSDYALVILPGDKKVDFDALAKMHGARTASMAQPNKIKELLECEVGRVPPFSFNSAVKVIADKDLVADNDKIYFSPGRLDLSFAISTKDYAAIIVKEGGSVNQISTGCAAQMTQKGIFQVVSTPTADKGIVEQAVSAPVTNTGAVEQENTSTLSV